MEDKEITGYSISVKTKKDRSVILKILNRKRGDVALSTALGIAKALGVSLDEIVNRDAV